MRLRVGAALDEVVIPRHKRMKSEKIDRKFSRHCQENDSYSLNRSAKLRRVGLLHVLFRKDGGREEV